MPKVWYCKLVVADDVEVPFGFDTPPRMAAIAAVNAHGVDVLACFSGWNGTLTESEKGWLDKEPHYPAKGER